MSSTRSMAVLTGLAGISLSAALAGCSTGSSDQPAAAPSAVDSSSPTTEPLTAQPQDPGTPSRYADGTYSADGVYGSGPSSIGVSVTLVDDVVTAVEITPHATNPTSLDYQQRFAGGAPQEVVGRPIKEIQLDRVAGSSTTPAGFNAALDLIEEQAAR